MFHNYCRYCPNSALVNDDVVTTAQSGVGTTTNFRSRTLAVCTTPLAPTIAR